MENNLTGVTKRVERLAQEGRFELVEDLINVLAVDERRKAALWLLAWSYASRTDQRRIAYEALAEVSG